MKKTILGLVALVTFSSIATASIKYECSRYVSGDYKGFIEAEKKAYKKYKNELKMKVDYVKCK